MGCSGGPGWLAWAFRQSCGRAPKPRPLLQPYLTLGCLGKSVLSQQSHRAIGPLARPAGFSQGSGEGLEWVITLFLQSCWVQGCRETTDHFLLSLQKLSWPLRTSIGEQSLRALERKGLWRTSPSASPEVTTCCYLCCNKRLTSAPRIPDQLHRRSLPRPLPLPLLEVPTPPG